jgi:hypothetical protein
MTPRLKTGHKDPQIPKDARLMTGKEMWYTAPIRPEATMKQAVIEYPAHTQSQVSHQESPVRILDDTTISQSRIVDTNHPRVDIDGISQPKGHKIPRSPQALGDGHRIKIITEGISEAPRLEHTL